MRNAKYISLETREIEERKRLTESVPTLPPDIELEKALPKALKQLSIKNCINKNTSCCNKDMMILIEPLLISNNGQFVSVKDQAEREKIRESLEMFVKLKTFKMLKEYSSSINQILRLNIFWVRDISTWDWKSRNTYKQLKSLIEHLFCTYDVPEFMFECWTEKNHNATHLDWFLHLASGGSTKDLHRYPIVATKKMLHEFISTPFPGYSIDDAVRRSQVIGLGGDERLANAILMSRLRHDFNNNGFWTTVIQFFIGIPMLNLDEVGTVIDYINEKKFVTTRIVVDGVATYRAEMPGFSMKGRNVETLIRDTHAWHKSLRQLRRQAGGGVGTESYKPDLTSKWKRSNVKPFSISEGKNERKKIWHLAEITNAADLYDEGKSMGHCVYSYLRSCIDGKCSIFSLRVGNVSMVTIEVRDMRAVQIRGPRNRKPSDKEMSIINNWSKTEHIEITKYAVAGR